ncbi:hypothetical protein D3C73_1509700 [compost metagenome]
MPFEVSFYVVGIIPIFSCFLITRSPNDKIHQLTITVLVVQIGKVHDGRLTHINWVGTDDLGISRTDTH